MFFSRKEIVGVDISDRTIEIAHLEMKNKCLNIVSTNQLNLPAGIVERGRIIDEVKLAQFLNTLFSKADPIISLKDIVFALPESQVYLHNFSIDSSEKNNIESIVMRRAGRHFLVKEDDLIFNYKITREEKDRIEILIVGTSLEVFNEWNNFFKKNNFNVVGFDIETLAAFRAVFSDGVKEPVMIVDIGSSTTNIGVFNENGLVYSHMSQIAGNLFDNNISIKMKISVDEARNQREKIDLTTKSRTKVVASFKSDLDHLALEINQVLEYVKNKGVGMVKEMILIGGASQNVGFDKYLANKVDIKEISQFTKESNRIINAIGIGIREIEKKWHESDPCFTEKNIKRVDKRFTKNNKNSDGNERENIIVKLKESRRRKKGKKQVSILLLFLLFSVTFFLVAFRMNQINREERRMSMQESLESFSEIQTFSVAIPVAISFEELTTDRASGRVFKDLVEESTTLNRAQIISRRRVENRIKESESIWPAPLNNFYLEDEITYPIEFVWFIYSNQSVNDMLVTRAVESIGDQEYLLSNIVKKEVEVSDNPNILIMRADVTLNLQNKVE